MNDSRIDDISHNKVFDSLKRNSFDESSVLNKKQKILSIAEIDTVGEGTLNDNNHFRSDEIPSTNRKEFDKCDGIDNEICVSTVTECTCSGLLFHEEVRLLRFLQTTRININVRQVHSDLTKRINQ